jgi:squalene-associated FAD-dependent desaturase
VSSDHRVIVIGGGLAGLAAAIKACDDGWQVTLLESRPRLGGATHSFTRDFEGGKLVVDNGQHVFLRCCTAYREFLRRLGVDEDAFLQAKLDVPIVDPATGKRSRLKRDRLPAPLHLGRTLATYGVLSPVNRARAIWGALALKLVNREAASSDERSFGDWLRAHGQTRATIDGLFDIFTVATLNAHADDASLRLGAMVFQDGLLRHSGACDIGYSRVPLGELHGAAAHRALLSAQADVRLRTRVRAIDRVDDRWRAHTDDAVLEADAVVLATPHDVAADLLPRDLVGADVADAPKQLAMSPILNVHVVYDRVVLTEPFVAAVGSPVQFVFDRTRASGLRDGQYIAVSVSAADNWIDQPVAQLREIFVPELERVLPSTNNAAIRDFFVTRERTATFRPAPGSGSYRLATQLPAEGLLVAGAWTDTGWPATMEGAVRSGLAAAEQLRQLRQLRRLSGGSFGISSPRARLTRHDDGNGLVTGMVRERAARDGEFAEEALA